MMSHRELNAEVKAQVSELIRQGQPTRLPRSSELLNAANALLVQDMGERKGIQLTWRTAALCHSVDNAFALNWAGAFNALHLIPRGLMRQQEPALQTLDDTQARALMLVNRAFAAYKLGIRASFLANEALKDFQKVRNRNMQPWMGVAWMIEAHSQDNNPTARRECAIEARRYLDRDRQPELYTIALKWDGHGGSGIYRPEGGEPRRATFRIRECLYYFNE